MSQLTDAQRAVRTAPKSNLAKAKNSLTKLEQGLAALPLKFAKMEAEQQAKIEAQRKLVQQLENGEGN